MTTWKPDYAPEDCPRPVAAMAWGKMRTPPWCVNCGCPLDPSGIEHDSPWNAAPCPVCGGYLARHSDACPGNVTDAAMEMVIRSEYEHG